MHSADRPVSRADDRDDSGGVLWRAPTSLRRRIRDSAKGLSLSQNAYITTTAIFGELMIARGPEGLPTNVRALFAHMNESVERGSRLVLDACVEEDWQAVYETLMVLSDARLVRDIVERRPILERRMPDAGYADGNPQQPDLKVIAFGFTFSREGMKVWKLVGPLVVKLLDALLAMKSPTLAADMSPV